MNLEHCSESNDINHSFYLLMACLCVALEEIVKRSVHSSPSVFSLLERASIMNHLEYSNLLNATLRVVKN